MKIQTNLKGSILAIYLALFFAETFLLFDQKSQVSIWIRASDTRDRKSNNETPSHIYIEYHFDRIFEHNKLFSLTEFHRRKIYVL